MKKSEIFFEFQNYTNRNYQSEATIKAYNSCCKKFIYDKHPSDISNLSFIYIQKYLDKYLQNNQISLYNQTLSTLKVLYRDVLNQNKLKDIKPIKQYRKLKNLPKFKDIKLVISKMHNLKHKSIVLTLLSTGIRISELLNIKISDINSEKMNILIQKGKGGRSRLVPLTNELLIELRKYYKKYRPKIYLFEGLNGKYSKTSVNNMIKNHFGAKCHAHIFRHVYTSYLVDKDVNTKRIKNMTGHTNDKSVDWYIQYSESSIENNINPIKEVA